MLKVENKLIFIISSFKIFIQSCQGKKISDFYFSFIFLTTVDGLNLILNDMANIYTYTLNVLKDAYDVTLGA